jgi:hypothetical protein
MLRLQRTEVCVCTVNVHKFLHASNVAAPAIACFVSHAIFNNPEHIKAEWSRHSSKIIILPDLFAPVHAATRTTALKIFDSANRPPVVTISARQ